jgi:hypothetical protein
VAALTPAAIQPRVPTGPTAMNYVNPGPVLAASPSWWQSLSPPVRSATVMLFFNAGLQSVSSYLPGFGFVITAPFQVVSYFAQGLLVGKLAREDYRYQRENYLTLGLQSVMWSTLLSTGLLLLMLFVLGAVTLGGIVVLLPVMVISQFGNVFLNICFTTLGAWLYERSGGKNILKISLIVGLVSFVGICALMTGLATLLAAIGYSYFSGGLL